MRKSRLSGYKRERLIEHFVVGTTLPTAAALLSVNKTTAAYYFHRLRVLICAAIDGETPFHREVDIDESYFGGKRKGKRSRGAAYNVSIFGILKQGGKIYTKVIPDVRSDRLIGIMVHKIVRDSTVYGDSLGSYNALDLSDFRHCRIDHCKLFADRQNHTSEIENFWNQAKRHLHRFNGIPRQHFPLYLKECEWRFNNSGPKEQLRLLKQLVKEHLA